MQTYGKYSPAPFGSKGLALPDQSQWLVAPVSRNRDSDCLAQSNFASALAQLGGESETVEVHRFGHWGPGWYEIILIDPADTECVRIAEEIESTIEDSPVLDENDLSERESAAYYQAWTHGYGKQDFRAALREKFSVRSLPHVDDVLDDADDDRLLGFFESLIPSGDYHDGDAYPRTRYAAQNCTIAALAAFIRAERKILRSANLTQTQQVS